MEPFYKSLTLPKSLDDFLQKSFLTSYSKIFNEHQSFFDITWLVGCDGPKGVLGVSGEYFHSSLMVSAIPLNAFAFQENPDEFEGATEDKYNHHINFLKNEFQANIDRRNFREAFVIAVLLGAYQLLKPVSMIGVEVLSSTTRILKQALEIYLACNHLFILKADQMTSYDEILTSLFGIQQKSLLQFLYMANLLLLAYSYWLQQDKTEAFLEHLTAAFVIKMKNYFYQDLYKTIFGMTHASLFICTRQNYKQLKHACYLLHSGLALIEETEAKMECLAMSRKWEVLKQFLYFALILYGGRILEWTKLQWAIKEMEEFGQVVPMEIKDNAFFDDDWHEVDPELKEMSLKLPLVTCRNKNKVKIVVKQLLTYRKFILQDFQLDEIVPLKETLMIIFSYVTKAFPFVKF